MSSASALAEALLLEVKARAAEAQIVLAEDILPRLQEVTEHLAETSLARMAGEPDEEREAVLAARARMLAAAGGIEVASILRDVVRQRIVDGVGAVFGILIRAVTP